MVDKLSFLKILADIFSCSHHRCPEYFMESIRSPLGFYGWKCQSYFHYLRGQCPYDNSEMSLAGEDCDASTRGMFLIATNSMSPFARGRRLPADELRTKAKKLDSEESSESSDISRKLLSSRHDSKVFLINDFGKIADI